ncbi:uncharacterized protein [Macrobrachium rosenbergii]|uniref:uncharacterized protein isoform X1 n=1 Tax=Macrobrachium rosenbergii TaxID=79674 RepID=UPI0034D69D6F
MESYLFKSAAYFSTALVFVLLATVEAVPLERANLCYFITCRENCDPDKPEKYQPQRCERCTCLENGLGRLDPNSLSIPERIAAMESSISELKATTGVQLCVVLLMLLVMIVLFVQGADNFPKLDLPVFFCKKKMINASKDNAPTKNSIGVADTLTISRIVDKQSDSSLQVRTSSMTQSASGDSSLQIRPSHCRMRQPSESSCPEEGSDIGPQGYDNLGLSTSTIDIATTNNDANASTDTLGAGISTNTLHTTLPSEDYQASDEHTNTRM